MVINKRATILNKREVKGGQSCGYPWSRSKRWRKMNREWLANDRLQQKRFSTFANIDKREELEVGMR
jgi:hypothetical protein